MNIEPNKKVIKELTRQQQLFNYNNSIECAMFTLISNSSVYINNIDPSLHESVVELFKGNIERAGRFSKDSSLLGGLILQQFQVAGEKEVFPDYVMNEIVKAGKVFHHGDLEQNAYYANIHLDSEKCGNFCFDTGVYRKHELDFYNCTVKKNGISIPQICTFDYDFEYPRITESGDVWMSISPNEIFTMQKPISQAHGKVLTLGCGMGYFAYMASLKASVDSVTIIESSSEVINLFNEFILPQFSNKEKISVVREDAFKYIDGLDDGLFQFCFADIWQGSDDCIPYLKLKNICRKFKKMKMSYWVESGLINYLTGSILMLLMESLYARTGVSNTAIPLPKKEREIIRILNEAFSNVVIKSANDIKNIFDPNHISKIL